MFMSDGIERTIVRFACPHSDGPHMIAVHCWGDEDAPAVLCAHGLSRNARDYDVLAAHLARTYRVICIDLPGRGESEWLRDPAQYGDETYLADIRFIMNQLVKQPVRWIGTSLGGRLGMKMAAYGNEVCALVLNDIGAEIDGADLGRLRANGATEVSFANMKEAEAWMRVRYAEFGQLSDARWRTLVQTSVQAAADSRLRPSFDPRAVPTASPAGPVSYWDIYGKIRCPMLVLRGAQSKLLSRATCEAMKRNGPLAKWVEIPGAGHTPDLGNKALIEVVSNFLGGVS